MVTISFPDRDTEKRALAYLLGRFSGLVLRSGEHLRPSRFGCTSRAHMATLTSSVWTTPTVRTATRPGSSSTASC